MLIHKENNPVFSQAFLVLTVIFIFATGLLNLPFTISFVQDTKTYLMLLFSLITLGAYALLSFKKKSLSVVLNPLTWPILLFLVTMLISTFIAPAYPVEGLLGLGGAYLTLACVALLGGNILPKNSAQILIKAISLVALINIVGSATQAVGFGPAQALNRIFSLNLPTDLSFSLLGGSLISLEITILGLVGIIWHSMKNKKVDMFAALIMPILIIGLGLYAWSLRPAGPTPLRLPSLLVSWSVTLDTLRAPKTALIGSGPESFVNSYRQFKPSFVNSTTDWALIFGSAFNLPLTLLATTGFAGLITWVWLCYRVFRLFINGIKAKESSALLALLALTFAINFVLPPNVILVFLQSILLAGVIASKKDKYPSIEVGNLNLAITSPHRMLEAFANQNQVKGTNVPAYLFSLTLLSAAIFGSYHLVRAYRSQTLLLAADRAIQKSEAVGVYEQQQQAVNLNPYLDINRRAYALTNVMIAGALANKTDITDQEKEQINVLLQQAVREARAATVLDPSDSQNWQVLASVYSNMIGVAQDADQWAVQAYVNAIQTYPTDPNLRIGLGGVLLATKQLDQAISVFAQAVSVKPDFANSQYNLAVALRQAGRLEESKNSYQQTLALVDSSSEDFIKLTKEIESLDKEIEKMPKKASDKESTQTNQKGELPVQTNSITEQQIETNQAETVAPQQDIILPENN